MLFSRHYCFYCDPCWICEFEPAFWPSFLAFLLTAALIYQVELQRKLAIVGVLWISCRLPNSLMLPHNLVFFPFEKLSFGLYLALYFFGFLFFLELFFEKPKYLCLLQSSLILTTHHFRRNDSEDLGFKELKISS